MNTYVYSVTPVIAQDYNPVYTRVCRERERDNVVYWKTNGKINNDLQCVYTQCFPVRFDLRKTGASLSIEMTVALEV